MREYTLYLLWMSYYSGKMHAYLRYKEIPHRAVEPHWWQLASEIYPNTGFMKVPTVRTPEGRWLQDSTPMIDWFEQRYPAGAVLPDDPAQAFLCRLLEDYADEWLWRPAMHYRWSYPGDADSTSFRFVHSFLKMPAPKWMLARDARRRQKALFVDQDGVDRDTRDHVEGIYLRNLQWLEAIFRRRPFLLGDKPCLADFGFFASMFRHFSQDPTPSVIMQMRAPAVFEWVARLWNARHSELHGDWLAPGAMPDGWRPILQDVGAAYLPYLHANAVAWRDGARRFDCEIQGARYRSLRPVQYRVWCRERLQEHYESLPEAARATVTATLADTGCLEPLLRDGRIASNLHQGTPPLCAPIEVGLLQKLRLFAIGTPWDPPRRALAREARAG